MRLSGRYQILAPRPRVYSAITDPVVLQSLIDGCEKIVQTGEESYDAYLKIGLAGMKSTCVCKIEMTDRRPLESLLLIVEGRGLPGSVRGRARVQLSDQNSQTGIQCEGEVQVGGLIAALGSRVMEGAAQRMMDEFFRKFGEQVKGLV